MTKTEKDILTKLIEDYDKAFETVVGPNSPYDLMCESMSQKLDAINRLYKGVKNLLQKNTQ